MVEENKALQQQLRHALDEQLHTYQAQIALIKAHDDERQTQADSEHLISLLWYAACTVRFTRRTDMTQSDQAQCLQRLHVKLQELKDVSVQLDKQQEVIGLLRRDLDLRAGQQAESEDRIRTLENTVLRTLNQLEHATSRAGQNPSEPPSEL